MVHLEGDQEFALPRQELWLKLTDLSFVVQCIPDVSEVREVQEKSATVVVRPGFSFVRGEIQLSVAKVEETIPRSARWLIKGKGVGSSSEVEVAFELDERKGGSMLHWAADIKQLGGLLKAVPQGLLQAAAQKVIGDLMAKLEKNLQANPV